jgi:hypothetical protein
MIVKELYDALIEAGTSEEKARAAGFADTVAFVRPPAAFGGSPPQEGES